ncbi:hypothetical protein Tco_0701610 [Tanacetum coccineum]
MKHELQDTFKSLTFVSSSLPLRIQEPPTKLLFLFAVFWTFFNKMIQVAASKAIFYHFSFLSSRLLWNVFLSFLGKEIVVGEIEEEVGCECEFFVCESLWKWVVWEEVLELGKGVGWIVDGYGKWDRNKKGEGWVVVQRYLERWWNMMSRFSNERSQSIQKDEEILLLKAQLVDAQAEAESSRSYAQHLAEEKMALLVKVEQERADAAEYKASCHWAVKYLEGGKNNHFAGLDDFRHKVEGLLEKQEDKLRKLSIEYDEELYPHMLSTIAERRWLISHGLRLAAMSTLESQEVRQSFGDVVKCALARGKAEAVEELHERRLLTVPAAQVPGYNQKAYEELVAAMEAMKLLELPHIAQLERDQDYPIGVIMTGLTLARHATEGAEAQPDYFLKPDVSQLQVPIFASPRDILNPFALEKEVPLKESLEAHAIRLAKKKGVKGKAILCGVGAAHLPRSDGVPVSVATVSPKDSELLGKLEEAGDAAYQVGRSEQSRCHSI